MGMTGRQVLLQVELPLGLPRLAGIRISAIFVIATATIAAVAGGGGLGQIIVSKPATASAASSQRRCGSRRSFLAAFILRHPESSLA